MDYYRHLILDGWVPTLFFVILEDKNNKILHQEWKKGETKHFFPVARQVTLEAIFDGTKFE